MQLQNSLQRMDVSTMVKRQILGACKFHKDCNNIDKSLRFIFTRIIPFRGVILYAMVCGRLPFGDDAQVKKMQAQHRQLTFSRNISTGKSEYYFLKFKFTLLIISGKFSNYNTCKILYCRHKPPPSPQMQ